MTRIKIVVEGPTEESFIKNILAPQFWSRQIYVTPLVLGVAGHKGGNVSYARVKKDILLNLKSDQKSICSTMVDLYGIGSDFPGLLASEGMTGHEKVALIERGMREDIAHTVPELRPDLRFIPYIQVHEFESLLFSDPQALATALRKENLAGRLTEIRNGFATPEHINDDPNTAPSKRILGLYRSYQKIIEGTLAAKAIGVIKMREICPHFNDWLEHMESFGEAKEVS